MTDAQYLRAVTIGEPERLRGHIVVAGYDPQWPVVYERLATEITAGLTELIISLDHIGSTSVPGLVAKPIIDIDLIVPDPDDENSYVPTLEKLGYRLRIREPEWHRHRVLKHHAPDVNLHVFGPDAEPHRRNLAFRDWLRHHAADRDLYGDTKRKLARRRWEYLQEYADAKNEVVATIMRRAGYDSPT